MLTIKGRGEKWREWHVGDGPLPEVEGPVVTVQADGHELRWLRLALEVGATEANKDYYRKVWGVENPE